MAKASRPCPQPGCPHLAPCPEHTPKAWAGSTRAGTNTHQWRKIRHAALARDAHRCVQCGSPATQVDHIVNRASGGKDTLSNAQTLCDPCHKTKTDAEKHRARWS